MRFDESHALALTGLALSSGIAFVATLALAQSGVPNVAGNWRFACNGRRGEHDAALQIQQDGAKLMGTYSATRGSELLTGSIDGTRISLNAGRLTFTGDIDGASMRGQNERGRPCSATRE